MSTSNTAERRPLGEDYIVDVAMQLLREQGVEKLSMRQLSTRLGVAVGATYRHVSGKQELLELCLRRIYTEADRPREPNEDPRAWVRELLVRLFEVMSNYQGMSAWSAANARLDAVSLTPPVVEALITAGMDQDQASRTMHVLYFFIAGALTTDYRSLMARVGVQDYLGSLRKDIDHILMIPGKEAAETVRPKARRRPPRSVAR
ncbi:MAG: putative TetR-family transcriptional regulator [Frankiales bacterium]|nr:putative TetR-family transcriptional regulator [Frankiales bacterium]